MALKPKHPKLIVFDLDYTLWPFYIDSDVQPPFRRSSKGTTVEDHHGQIVKIYPEVPEVLESLYKENLLLAVASRTSEIQGAHQLTSLLGWDKYFKYKEIYPGSKLTHFKNNDSIVDNRGKKIKTYPEVTRVLETISKMNILMAAASRTTETKGAHQLTTLLGWDIYFKYKEIYPGSKITHFQKFQTETGFDYSEMLFFDDEMRNIHDISGLNVKCVHVKNGMTMHLLKKGLAMFE